MKDSNIARLYEVEKGFYDYNPSVPCIEGAVIGFMTSPEFRSYLDHGLELYKEKFNEHGKLGWLANAKQSGVFVPEDTKWVIEDWNPRAYNAGMRYMAMVLPDDVFAELGVMEYSELSHKDGTLNIQHFKDIETAREWLREQLTDVN